MPINARANTSKLVKPNGSKASSAIRAGSKQAEVLAMLQTLTEQPSVRSQERKRGSKILFQASRQESFARNLSSV
jgi:hypothetical protein